MTEIKEIRYVERNAFEGPAAVNMRTGVMYLNGPLFNKYRPAIQRSIIEHERGHVELNTDSEIDADAFAFDKLSKQGYNLRELISSLSDVLTFNTPEHYQRLREQVIRALKFDYQTNGNLKAKAVLDKYMCNYCDKSSGIDKGIESGLIRNYLGNDSLSRKLDYPDDEMNFLFGKLKEAAQNLGDKIENKIDKIGDTKFGDIAKTSINQVTFNAGKTGYQSNTKLGQSLTKVYELAKMAGGSLIGIPGANKFDIGGAVGNPHVPNPGDQLDPSDPNSPDHQAWLDEQQRIADEKKAEEEAAAKKQQQTIIIVAVVVVIMVISIIIYKKRQKS